MSVQLIISPQSAVSATTSTSSTTTTTTLDSSVNYIVDGENFSSINTSQTRQEPQLLQYSNVILAQSAVVPNTWFRWRVPDTGAQPDYPVQIGSQLVLNSTTNIAGTFNGFFQRIQLPSVSSTGNNMFQLQVKARTVGGANPTSLRVRQYNGDGGNTWGFNSIGNSYNALTFDNNYSTQTWDFELPSFADQTLFFQLPPFGSSAEPQLEIEFIRVYGLVTTTTTTTNDFVDIHNQVILDLYEDETIPLTLSVDDFKDVATKTQSYSKAFHLPATKKNNRIFGNLFEVTKASGLFTFNPYKKTSVMLKENGFIVFEGFLKLIDIVDKKGEISYNVNLYSDSVALMDSMKDLTFADLDFTELDHTYNLTSIASSQTGALPLLNQLQADSFAGAAGDTTTSVLKYPFLNWAGSIRRNATSGQVSDGATAGRPSLKKLEDGFRPFINVKYLVDNIFKGTDFTYSSAFFDSSYFSNLYMDFNWGEEPDGAAPLRNDFIKRKSTLGTATAVGQTFTNVPVNVDNGGNDELWNNSFYGFQSDVNNLHCTGSYRIQVINTATVNKWSAEMRICVFNSNNSVIETIEQYKWVDVNPGGSGDIQGSFDVVLNNGDYIQMEAKDFDSDAKIYISDTTTSFLNINYNNNAVQVATLLDAARSEMVQWDFLKGLFTMFNLITLQDKQNPSNILIEPYNDVFKDDVTTLDWTHKVDVSDIKLKPIDLKKRVVFKYEEDEEDYPFRVYKKATGGFLYGSLTLDSSELDLLSGEDEIIASPFAATIMKDLFDDTPELVAPSIYGSNEEVTEFGSIKNLPRILFDTGVYVASNTFYVPAQNGGSDDNKDHYSLFSHTSAVPATATDDDLNFGACQLIGTSMGVSPLNNLYSTYYARYFQELYSPDVKTMTLKVLLTPNDIANFNFYDKVFIKNREYRVDKINYKPNDLSTVDFILIT